VEKNLSKDMNWNPNFCLVNKLFFQKLYILMDFSSLLEEFVHGTQPENSSLN
jgi:hypothetical protein